MRIVRISFLFGLNRTEHRDFFSPLPHNLKHMPYACPNASPSCTARLGETFVPFFSWRGILFPLPPKAVCSQRKVMLSPGHRRCCAHSPPKGHSDTFLGGFFGSLLKASPKNKPFYIFVICFGGKKCAIIPECKCGGKQHSE